MNSKVIDLDVLKPEPLIVRLNGHEMDLAFIPCGITFEVDELVRKIQEYTPDMIQEDDTKAQEAFDLGMKLAAVFFSWKYPDMNEDWFRANVSSEQLIQITTLLKTSLGNMYERIQRPKNAEPPKRENRK